MRDEVKEHQTFGEKFFFYNVIENKSRKTKFFNFSPTIFRQKEFIDMKLNN